MNSTFASLGDVRRVRVENEGTPPFHLSLVVPHDFHGIEPRGDVPGHGERLVAAFASSRVEPSAVLSVTCLAIPFDCSPADLLWASSLARGERLLEGRTRPTDSGRVGTFLTSFVDGGHVHLRRTTITRRGAHLFTFTSTAHAKTSPQDARLLSLFHETYELDVPEAAAWTPDRSSMACAGSLPFEFHHPARFEQDGSPEGHPRSEEVEWTSLPWLSAPEGRFLMMRSAPRRTPVETLSSWIEALRDRRVLVDGGPLVRSRGRGPYEEVHHWRSPARHDGDLEEATAWIGKLPGGGSVMVGGLSRPPSESPLSWATTRRAMEIAFESVSIVEGR